jgi:methionine sulfoxide reductase heme-binding subunit
MLNSVVSITAHRIAASWPWYIVRAAGFVAAGLVVLLVLSGIGQVTGFTYRFIEPVKAWAAHKAMAIALLVAIVIHVGFLLVDHFVHFSLAQVLVPFTSTYNNKTAFLGLALGPLGVTMGIFALYGIVILVATSLGWIDRKPRTWRKLHYLSYAVALLIFLHALYVGTDIRYGSFRAAWIALGLTVVIGVVSRLWRARTISAPTRSE